MAKTDFQAPADLRIVGSRSTIAGEARFSLVAMKVDRLPDGAIVYVQSVKAYFQLDKASTETADGISVVAAFGGGRWYRKPSDFAGISPWLQQTTWYVDAVDGDDENTGLTSGVPIKTFAELRRRFGDDPLIDQTYHVFMLSDVPEVYEMSARFSGDLGAIWLHGGGKTPLATDTISAWTSFAPGDEPAITGTAIADFSPYKGARCRLTSGASVGFTFFLGDAANSGAVGNEIWRHGILAHYTSAGFSPVTPSAFQTSADDPGAADFVIETLLQMRGFNLRSTRLNSGTNGLASTAGFIISEVYMDPAGSAQPLGTVDHTPVLGETSDGAGQPLFFRCIFDGTLAVTGNVFTLVGCCCGDNGTSDKDGLTLSGCQNVGVRGLDATNIVLRRSGVRTFNGVFCDADDGAAYVQFHYGSETMSGDTAQVGMWNGSASVSAFYVDELSTLHAQDIWGAVDGGAVGFEVDGRMFYLAIADINGLVVSGNDSEVGGTVKAYGDLPYVEPTNNAMIVVQP